MGLVPSIPARKRPPALPPGISVAGFLHALGALQAPVHLAASNVRQQPIGQSEPHDGDCVSIVPSVGGATVRLGPFHVGPEPIDVVALSSAVADPGAGAIVTFDGIVRNNARGKSVQYLEYEAYPEMAAQVLAQIAGEMAERWELCAVAMAHRVGRLEIGESSIGLAVSAPHRQAAFASCAYAMDRIKQVLPVWKKEFASDGATWIEGPHGAGAPAETASNEG